MIFTWASYELLKELTCGMWEYQVTTCSGEYHVYMHYERLKKTLPAMFFYGNRAFWESIEVINLSGNYNLGSKRDYNSNISLGLSGSKTAFCILIT